MGISLTRFVRRCVNDVRSGGIAALFSEASRKRLRDDAAYCVSMVRSTTDRRYYRRISELVPEIASYKSETLNHLKTIASERGCAGLKGYYKLLKSDPAEVSYLKQNLTLKGSHFFRGNDWDIFGSECLSTLAEKDSVRAWCAGCSSGEEVYSLVMALFEYVEPEKVEVLATDYNEELLERCRAAQYGRTHLPEIPEKYQRYVNVPPKGRFTLAPEVVGCVRVEAHNLLADDYPGLFDVIVCRNVIKFFSSESIALVQGRLASSLSSGGFLFLSDDDNARGVELIANPEELGLRQIAGKSIYQRVG